MLFGQSDGTLITTSNLEDLCAYTRFGFRTLQRCFASYFQMSPLEYIKTRRLNEARRALVNTDPSVCSVTQIALGSGFTHLGRFAVEYRAFFGESPSETLRHGSPGSHSCPSFRRPRDLGQARQGGVSLQRLEAGKV